MSIIDHRAQAPTNAFKTFSFFSSRTHPAPFYVQATQSHREGKESERKVLQSDGFSYTSRLKEERELIPGMQALKNRRRAKVNRASAITTKQTTVGSWP